MKNLFLWVSMALILNACGRFGNESKKTTQKQRIVCISKQYSEIMFALSAEQDLVAVDLSSTYPEKAKKLPTVGYHRALTIEGILAHKPTLILQDDNIGPPQVLSQLEKLKIPMKIFKAKAGVIDSTSYLIREMGAYFGRKKEADSLCKKLEKDMQQARSHSKNYSKPLKVLVIHFGQASNVFLVMTQKNKAAQLIELAGGTLAVNGEKGMQHLSPEIVAAADPDVILLTDVGFDRLGSIEKIKELPGLTATKAAKANKIYRFEEHDLVYFGPRTGENIVKLQDLIHQ